MHIQQMSIDTISGGIRSKSMKQSFRKYWNGILTYPERAVNVMKPNNKDFFKIVLSGRFFKHNRSC